ncbi:hypothetical protein GTP45_27440 [Pseudoduganella sp. FT55W]|uniref:Uncharacterized protein n=1 Tax=Duganella rivi TaxID=2666083 RepID=A0A7X4GWQ3_9BURK|nr:hypothetical protein [Duganella rivi]MYM70516.1 hypothetical protein [Duganella rivi]
MLNLIQERMAAALKKDGVTAEITFINAGMFSVLVDGAAAFAKAKAIMAAVPGVRFDSEDQDEECGNVAYYFF